ncbi:hypothetical protein MMPV_004196 [Pyropia vietnamensis]
MADGEYPWAGGDGGGGNSGGDGGGGGDGGDGSGGSGGGGGGGGGGASDASGPFVPVPSPPAAFGDAAFSRHDAERIGRMLDHRLTKSDCKQRAGPSGRKLTYLESWKVIDLANKIFGWDGWSCEMVSSELDFVEMTPPRGWSAHATVVLKVTVRGGQCHVDCGTGSTENQRTKADAISLARKEAFTDARKRALKNFGNALGNSLYDRGHLQYMQSARAAQYAAMDSVTDAVMREPMGGVSGMAGGSGAAMAAAASPVTPRGGGRHGITGGGGGAGGGGMFALGSGVGVKSDVQGEGRRTNQFGSGGGGGGSGGLAAPRGIGAPPGMGSRGGGLGGCAGGGGGGGVGGTKRALPSEEPSGGGVGGGGMGRQGLSPAMRGGGGGVVSATSPIQGPPGGPPLNGEGASHLGMAPGSATPGMMNHLRARKTRADGASGSVPSDGGGSGGGGDGGGEMGAPSSGRLKPPPRGIGMGAAPLPRAAQFLPHPVGVCSQAGPPPAKHPRSACGLADDEATLARLVGDGAFDDDPCTASS